MKKLCMLIGTALLVLSVQFSGVTLAVAAGNGENDVVQTSITALQTYTNMGFNGYEFVEVKATIQNNSKYTVKINKVTSKVILMEVDCGVHVYSKNSDTKDEYLTPPASKIKGKSKTEFLLYTKECYPVSPKATEIDPDLYKDTEITVDYSITAKLKKNAVLLKKAKAAKKGVKKLKKNTSVEILSLTKTKGFFKVKAGGKTGFLKPSLLK